MFLDAVEEWSNNKQRRNDMIVNVNNEPITNLRHLNFLMDYFSSFAPLDQRRARTEFWNPTT